MAFTVGSQASTSADPGPLAAITPSASSGVAILSCSEGDVDTGTGGARLRLSRVTGEGSSPTSVTPEKANKLSAAPLASAATGYGTPPTVGNPLILLGTYDTTTSINHRRWVSPSPRYPIFAPPSGASLYADKPGMGLVGWTRDITFAEVDAPGAVGVGRYRGKRSANRAGFALQDNVYGFHGASANPKNRTGAQGYIFLNALEWSPQVVQDAQCWLNLLNPAGTTYTLSLDGSVTPNGTLVRQTGKALTGSSTPAGALARQVAKVLSGSVTPAGALIKQLARAVSGSVTPAGALTKQTGKPLSGSVTPTGALVKMTGKALSGSVAAAGELVRQCGKALSGSVTAAGSLVRQVGKALSGAVTASGELARETRKVFAGSVTASGALALVKTFLLYLSGSVTPSGALTKAVGKSLSGSVTAAGTVTRLVSKSFAGSVTAVGDLTKRVALTFAGTVTAAGGLLKQIGKALLGMVTPSGDLTTSGGQPPPPPPSEGHRGPWPRTRSRGAPYPQRGPLSLPRYLKRRKD